MFGDLHFWMLRYLAYGFVLAGIGKLLVLMLAGTALGPVKLHFELITMVLYLGAGGTIFIRQGK